MNKEALIAPVLESLLQAPSLAVTAVDKQGCVILWSPSASRMFGWTESEVLGRFLPIIPQDQHQEFLNRLHTGINGGTVIAFEGRRLRRDGSWIDVNLWTVPLRDSKGATIGVLGLHADITSRKKAEEALLGSEARFRGIFRAAPSGIVLVSREGRFLQVNAAFCDFLGYSEQELLAKTILDATHPDDRERSTEVRRRIWDGEKPQIRRFEKRYLRKDGGVVWGEVSISLIRDAEGRALYSISHVLDITERKQAETALKKSEERFRALIEHGFDVIALLRADTTVKFTTESPSGVLGYQPDELVGRGALELVHPEDLARVTEVFGQLLHVPGGTMTEEFRCRHQDGSWRWIEASGTNCLGQPHVDGIILNYHDITLRKQTEEVLRESEGRYRLMAETIPQAIWRSNTQGKVMECNRRWYEYTGQNPGRGLRIWLDESIAPRRR